MRSRYLALVLAALPSTAMASGQPAGSADAGHPFEECLMAKAIALEPSGIEVSSILAVAERECRPAKGGLSGLAAGEIVSKVRLAVMQQRSNALNTRRRG